MKAWKSVDGLDVVYSFILEDCIFSSSTLGALNAIDHSNLASPWNIKRIVHILMHQN